MKKTVGTKPASPEDYQKFLLRLPGMEISRYSPALKALPGIGRLDHTVKTIKSVLRGKSDPREITESIKKMHQSDIPQIALLNSVDREKLAVPPTSGEITELLKNSREKKGEHKNHSAEASLFIRTAYHAIGNFLERYAPTPKPDEMQEAAG